MRNINEAYKHTMSVVESLKKEGIDVLIQEPRVIRESETPDELDVVKKYNNPNRLHWSYWRNVQFKVKTKEESQKVSFARTYLGINKISFDVGSGCGSIDWEIDWSFRLTGIEENGRFEDLDPIMEGLSLDCDL